MTATGCESSTAPEANCSTDATLDCPEVNFREYVLTVHVTSTGGADVPGASVRLDAPMDCCIGYFWNATTDVAGRAEFAVTLFQWRPPQPINIRVTPPNGSFLRAAVVSDSLVWQDAVSARTMPIVLPLVLEQ